MFILFSLLPIILFSNQQLYPMQTNTSTQPHSTPTTIVDSQSPPWPTSPLAGPPCPTTVGHLSIFSSSSSSIPSIHPSIRPFIQANRHHHHKTAPTHPSSPSPGCAAQSPRVAGLAAPSRRTKQQQQRVDRARVRASPPSPPATVVPGDHLCGWPPLGRTLGHPPLAANVLRDAPSRRFVRLRRNPVVTRAFGTQIWRSVAATSRTFSQGSDCWIDDFFAPSQSRFAEPTSSACISSTAAPFGVLPVPVRSWTLWLQLDPLYLSAHHRRRIVWRCLLA
ncbi:putative formin-like protein 5 [Iris pallida]|uniref:Formin-like protein 5 n=1 Tax=Iris pallida TaxID=29817 RepID=A0AAX6F9P7_IRIPA|nr:putative formin-like protein 5 [Iris pallida]